MKDKKNIIQFLPYFPPHKWWLETHADEWGKWWIKKEYWNVYNLITNFDQIPLSISPQGREVEQVIYEWTVIWYTKDWVQNLIVPSFEVISNFPVYKFWTSKYKLIIKYLKEKETDIVITRTRFFMTSFIWWLFARKNNIKWCHIEHGSDYVKLKSKLNSIIAYIYDRLIWKWIFTKSDELVWVSNACKRFINKEFVNRNINVVHRWVDIIEKEIKKEWEIKLVFVWRLVKLKWVGDLLKAFQNITANIKLIIIWDWDEKNNLEKIVNEKKLNVEFLWFKDKWFIIDFLYKNKCIMLHPSYQEWLPSTVIDWLLTWNIVVASDVWWTNEISEEDDLILFEAWYIEKLVKKIDFSVKNYDKLVGKSEKLVINRFSWNENIEKYYKIMRNEK
jgi:hypothetical protein